MTFPVLDWAEWNRANTRTLDKQDSPKFLRMGARLGYAYLLREDRSESLPLSTFVLPCNPFTIIRPFVIVHELILDDKGLEIGNRRILRWVGFRPFK